MAEALFFDRARDLGLDVGVASAGLLTAGRAAAEGSVKAMARRGLDLSEHRSRILYGTWIDEADLVVGMAREHVREVAVLRPDRFWRAFTLRELVRRAEAVGPRGDVAFDDWLAEVGRGRRPQDLLGESEADDVEDPIGRSQAVYDATADELEVMLEAMIELVWSGVVAPARSGDRPSGPGQGGAR